MKHVIVIETVDPDAGGERMNSGTADLLEKAVDAMVQGLHGVCVVSVTYNWDSALDALHKMYGLAPWNGGEGWTHRDL